MGKKGFNNMDGSSGVHHVLMAFSPTDQRDLSVNSELHEVLTEGLLKGPAHGS